MKNLLFMVILFMKLVKKCSLKKLSFHQFVSLLLQQKLDLLKLKEN